MSDLQTDASTERREIHFSGRVQGVGFRYATQRIAARHRVSGFVQNLFDGRVLLIVEGPTTEIDALVNELRSEMGRYIEGEREIRSGATGEFAGFSVRH